MFGFRQLQTNLKVALFGALTLHQSINIYIFYLSPYLCIYPSLYLPVCPLSTYVNILYTIHTYVCTYIGRQLHATFHFVKVIPKARLEPVVCGFQDMPHPL